MFKKMLKYAKLKLKKMYTQKSLKKKIFTLSSLAYSIFERENLKSHMPFPIFVYPFQKNLSSYANLINTYHKSLQFFSCVVAYWQTLENVCPKQMP